MGSTNAVRPESARAVSPEMVAARANAAAVWPDGNDTNGPLSSWNPRPRENLCLTCTPGRARPVTPLVTPVIAVASAIAHIVRGESAQRRRVSRGAADVKQSARQKGSITAQEGDVSRRATNALTVPPTRRIELTEGRAIERREDDGGSGGSGERDDVSSSDQSRRDAPDDPLRIDQRGVRGRVTRDTGVAGDGHLRAGERRKADECDVGREECDANRFTSGAISGS